MPIVVLILLGVMLVAWLALMAMWVVGELRWERSVGIRRGDR